MITVYYFSSASSAIVPNFIFNMENATTHKIGIVSVISCLKCLLECLQLIEILVLDSIQRCLIWNIQQVFESHVFELIFVGTWSLI